MAKYNEILQNLADRGLTLGSAESLTGGLFGAKVCEIPGASNVYKGGVIAYTPEVKSAVLGIKPSTITNNGVVSAIVAKEMAEGGAKALGVDICVSCTGNAGPTAQEGEAPVGRVYLGLSYQDNTWTIPLNLNGSRNEIRQATVDAMFAFINSLFVEIKNN